MKSILHRLLQETRGLSDGQGPSEESIELDSSGLGQLLESVGIQPGYRSKSEITLAIRDRHAVVRILLNLAANQRAHGRSSSLSAEIHSNGLHITSASRLSLLRGLWFCICSFLRLIDTDIPDRPVFPTLLGRRGRGLRIIKKELSRLGGTLAVRTTLKRLEFFILVPGESRLQDSARDLRQVSGTVQRRRAVWLASPDLVACATELGLTQYMVSRGDLADLERVGVSLEVVTDSAEELSEQIIVRRVATPLQLRLMTSQYGGQQQGENHEM
jgi:hypothetical protein